LRIRWLNDDHFLVIDRLGFDFLLRGRLQIASPLGFSAHALNRIHHVFLLRKKGVTQIRRPCHVLAQLFDDIRKSRQRLDARIVRQLGDRFGERFIFQRFVVRHPLLKLDDLQWISGSGQDLRNQRIGIKGDRRD
jgi:hypothetical protein